MFISRDLYGHPIVLHTHTHKHTFVVFSLKRKELVAAAAVEKNHFSCWRWGDCSRKTKEERNARARANEFTCLSKVKRMAAKRRRKKN